MRETKKAILNKLSKNIVYNKEAIIDAFNHAGIPLTTSATDKQIIYTIIKHANRPREKTSKKLIRNLAVVLTANKPEPEKTDFNSFFKKKTDGGGSKKNGFLKNLFKKKQNPDGSMTSRAGDFFRKNKKEITENASDLVSGLGSKGANEEISDKLEKYGGKYTPPKIEIKKKEKSSIGKNIFIGMGVLGLLVVGILVYKRING